MKKETNNKNKKQIIAEVVEKIISRPEYYMSQVSSGDLSLRDLEELADHLIGSGALENLTEKDWAELARFAEGELEVCPTAGDFFVSFFQWTYSVPLEEAENIASATLLWDHALIPL